MGGACALCFLEDAATLRGTNESVEDMRSQQTRHLLDVTDRFCDIAYDLTKSQNVETAPSFWLRETQSIDEAISPKLYIIYCSYSNIAQFVIS